MIPYQIHDEVSTITQEKERTYLHKPNKYSSE